MTSGGKHGKDTGLMGMVPSERMSRRKLRAGQGLCLPIILIFFGLLGPEGEGAEIWTVPLFLETAEIAGRGSGCRRSQRFMTPLRSRSSCTSGGA